ncbi:MAG: uracil-DNA glycosylase family protein [Croceitalea sp.]|nr:uracil-DNA glycosylase family protein [Croceitalea sp.]
MFVHQHPYEPFLFDGVEKLIVGTLPPPRFTTGDLKEGDVNFCYGSRDGQLWPILNRIFELNLTFATTEHAVIERKQFLMSEKIGICDIVETAERAKIDASDLGMQNVQLRDMFYFLKAYPTVHTLLFTGGNSKNGPEYFFRRYLKEKGLSLQVVSDSVPRVHKFSMSAQTGEQKVIKTVSLVAPSGAANRAIGSLESYKALKSKNPAFNTIDFRVMQYRAYF